LPLLFKVTLPTSDVYLYVFLLCNMFCYH
jgi:hypothetical protein